MRVITKEIRVEIKPKAIWVRHFEKSDEKPFEVCFWLWQDAGNINKIETHDPMDRVGGPYELTDFVDDEYGFGEKWFIFYVQDSYFPTYDLVRGDSFEEAYQNYLDFAAEHRHIKIEEHEMKDYEDEKTGEFRGNFTENGIAVDTENVQGFEVSLVRIDL